MAAQPLLLEASEEPGSSAAKELAVVLYSSGSLRVCSSVQTHAHESHHDIHQRHTFDLALVPCTQDIHSILAASHSAYQSFNFNHTLS